MDAPKTALGVSCWGKHLFIVARLSAMRRHFWTYLALSTMAFAQPILDLYGKNITVFSASKLSRLEVGLFLALVLAAPAIVAMAMDAFSRLFGPKVNESARLLLIGAFSLVLGFAVARWLNIERNRYAFGVALLMAVLIPWAFDRSKPVREWSRWLAILAFVVGGNAVFQLRPVLAAAEGPKSDAVMGKKDLSVLQIVFDEFPLYPLLADDGSINAERFPGFAELAANSTWYRNSIAASNFTHQAVPAVLASAEPRTTGGPFLYQYPHNIFTVFNGVTTVAGTEPVTSLCPASVCDTNAVPALSVGATRFGKFLKDAAAVYGQRVLPRYLRQYVPSIEGTWGGFGAVAGRFKEQFDMGALGQPDAIRSAVSDLVSDPNPRVQVVHALLPHAPWRLTPDGRVAPLSKEISTRNPDDADGVRDTYQTFLHQLGETDATISAVISELKKAGRWDSTMVVVTADHGISFLPGLPQRHTDFTDMGQSDDIFRIPTFIKYPSQKGGVASDCAITNLDLLPTILDVTGTRTSWTFAGRSIAESCPSRTRTVHSVTGETAVFVDGFDRARARAEHYSQIVSNDGPLSRVAAVGASADLIGRPIGDRPADPHGVSWTVSQKRLFKNVSTKRGARIPSLVTGLVTSSRALDEGTEGIIVVDGVAAGVIGELAEFDWTGEPTRYTAVLDYSLFTAGDHAVELYLRAPNGQVTRVGPPK